MEKKRNPQDATLRNTRARVKEIATLKADVRDLKRRVRSLEFDVVKKLARIQEMLVKDISARAKRLEQGLT